LKNNLISGSLSASASTKNLPDCNYKNQTNALSILFFGLIFLVQGLFLDSNERSPSMNQLKYYLHLLFLSSLSIFFSQDLIFADEVEVLQPIVMQASRLKTTAEKQAGSATVITEQEIKESGLSGLTEILQDRVGLDVVRSGTLGSTTSVFMRGAESDHTLVIIDGVQANSNTTGGFEFGKMNLDNIEKIEILRGPQSTVWGSDAIGGVISITTKKGIGKKPSQFASFEAGSFATFKETLGSSGAINENFDYSLTISRLDTEGINTAAFATNGKEKDGFQSTTLSHRLGYNHSDNTRIDFIGRWIKSSVDTDDSGTSDNPTSESKIDTFTLSLPITTHLTDWWKVKLLPSYFYDRDIGSQIYNRNTTIDIQNNLDLGKYYSVVFGAEYQNQLGHNVGQGFNHNTETYAYFLQAQFDYKDKILLTGGFRNDENSQYGDFLTYRFEGAYTFNNLGTRIHSAYGTGYRAPTFNDLYYPDYSDPDLTPEKNKSWEIGFSQSLLSGKIKLDVTYFESRFTNMIIAPASNNWVPYNANRAITYGTETSVIAQLPGRNSLSLEHTWLVAVDKEDGPLARRPKHKVFAKLKHTWTEKLTSSLGLRYRSESRSEFASAYILFNAAVSYKLKENIDIKVRGENIFNQMYEEVESYGTPGRAGYISVGYRF